MKGSRAIPDLNLAAGVRAAREGCADDIGGPRASRIDERPRRFRPVLGSENASETQPEVSGVAKEHSCTAAEFIAL